MNICVIKYLNYCIFPYPLLINKIIILRIRKKLTKKIKLTVHILISYGGMLENKEEKVGGFCPFLLNATFYKDPIDVSSEKKIDHPTLSISFPLDNIQCKTVHCCNRPSTLEKTAFLVYTRPVFLLFICCDFRPYHIQTDRITFFFLYIINPIRKMFDCIFVSHHPHPPFSTIIISSFTKNIKTSVIEHHVCN